ncbi:MAG: DUF433 domain-containing protein [Microcoleaceae cyanobacterium]
MQLEQYVEFIGQNDIRLKGTRVGIETILYEYIYCHQSLEEISQVYTNLTREQMYATILYFIHNQEDITQYMTDWFNSCRESEKKQDENPPEYIIRLGKLKA